MEVLHPTAELAPPNACVICKETPDRSQRVIDTGQSFVIPGSDIVGRAYVCEKCGLTIANRLGFVSNVQAKAAYHAAEAVAQRLSDVKERILTAATDIHDFINDVSLGNERSSVAKWVEGEFIETKDAPSKPKAAAKAGKAAGSGNSTPGKSGAGTKASDTVVEVAADGESQAVADGGDAAGTDAGA